jgi:hypothetical protein
MSFDYACTTPPTITTLTAQCTCGRTPQSLPPASAAIQAVEHDVAHKHFCSEYPKSLLQGEDPAYLWLPCWSGPPGLMARAVEALQRDDAPIAQPGTLPDLQVCWE